MFSRESRYIGICRNSWRKAERRRWQTWGRLWDRVLTAACRGESAARSQILQIVRELRRRWRESRLKTGNSEISLLEIVNPHYLLKGIKPQALPSSSLSASILRSKIPVVQKSSRVCWLILLSIRIWYPTVRPSRSVRSSATRSATPIAEILKGGDEIIFLQTSQTE